MHSTNAKYLTVREVALLWRQTPAAIYRKVAAGDLPAVRLGGPTAAIRIPADQLDRCLERAGRQERKR